MPRTDKSPKRGKTTKTAQNDQVSSIGKQEEGPLLTTDIEVTKTEAHVFKLLCYDHRKLKRYAWKYWSRGCGVFPQYAWSSGYHSFTLTVADVPLKGFSLGICEASAFTENSAKPPSQAPDNKGGLLDSHKSVLLAFGGNLYIGPGCRAYDAGQAQAAGSSLTCHLDVDAQMLWFTGNAEVEAQEKVDFSWAKLQPPFLPCFQLLFAGECVVLSFSQD